MNLNLNFLFFTFRFTLQFFLFAYSDGFTVAFITPSTFFLIVFYACDGYLSADCIFLGRVFI